MSTATLITNFAARTTDGAFPFISRKVVAQGLRDRTAPGGAVKIAQGYASLCGPAAFMFCWLRRYPENYTKYVIEMFEKGTAKIESLQVSPSTKCKNHMPVGKIPPVDWVALASLRDSSNIAFSYSAASDEFAGITLPGELVKWFKNAGGIHARESAQLLGDILKTENHISDAGNLSRRGRDVCLLINMQLLDASTMTKTSTIPNHWVVLTKPIYLKEGKIAIQVFTWAKLLRIPHSGVMNLDHFLNNYYGYVTV